MARSSHLGENDSHEFVTKVEFRTLYDCGTEWRVTAERVADGKVLERGFWLRWRAIRLARSHKRLRNWFEDHDQSIAESSVGFKVGPT